MRNCVPISKLSHLFGTALVVGVTLFAAGPVDAASPSDMPPSATASLSNINPTLPPPPDSVAAPPSQTLPPPGPGISIPEPPPATALSASIPPPPPSSGTALSNDAVKLAAQAEQAAMQAQSQADSQQVTRDREHIEKSFDRASNGILPLSPDQIREFMHKLEQTQAAAVPPSSGIPKGEVRVSTLSLDPGVEPPQINLSAGYVSTITVVDASGQPWPITDVGIGGNFEVSPTASGSHIIRITPLTRFGSGDLSVLLKDLSTPIIFRLSAGGPSVDLRYDARIPKYGPNGKIPLIDHPRLEAGDSDMMMILDNAPPRGAKRIKISGLDARTMAWSANGKVFVRTPLTLLSPAWDASVASADGMRVYEIGDAPVLLMSDNGAMLRGRLIQEGDND